MSRPFSLQPVDPISGRLLGPAVYRRAKAPTPPQSGSPKPQEAAPAALASPETVPDGTVEAVLAWVGYDSSRAKAAIAAEYDRGKPRKTLLAELSERI